MSTKLQKDDISIAILAGGKSSRMDGNNKGLMKLNNKLVLSRLISIACNYSSDVFVIANDLLDEYRKIHQNVYSDILEDYQGPLSGIYSALSYGKNQYLITLPCDGPFLSKEYFETLTECNNEKKIFVTKTGDRLQPVHARIDTSLKNNLKLFLQSGERKIDKWYTSCGYEEVLFDESDEMFINLNTKTDIEENIELIKKLYG
ncbi:MAG: molybdenum cofactor guanylyltransferase [Gammaproteobacteria bacterium]